MKIRQLLKNKFLLSSLYHLRVLEFCFYLSALYWHLTHKVPDKISTEDIYKLFYLDFLEIPEGDCAIIEMSEKKLVTRCKNSCPILSASMLLGIDTKISCKRLSEGPCKFFLRKFDKKIIFIRNYNHIRPYTDDCEETVIIP